MRDRQFEVGPEYDDPASEAYQLRVEREAEMAAAQARAAEEDAYAEEFETFGGAMRDL